MRIRYKKWARTELEASSFYVDNPEAFKGKWNSLFKNPDLPLNLELGCGKGQFISKLASENCRSVIISTGDDVTNVFVVLTIRETNPDAWIVTRASKFENISRLKKAGANKIVSPEIIGGKNLYFESAKPHLLKITVRHDFNMMLDEFKIIAKHKCVLENIEYNLPGIKTPLSREINAMELEDGEKFINLIESKSQQKEALKNLYESVNNVHSHLISGPDNATFDKLIKDLKEIEEIIGINLSNEEIAKITGKEIN